MRSRTATQPPRSSTKNLSPRVSSFMLVSFGIVIARAVADTVITTPIAAITLNWLVIHLAKPPGTYGTFRLSASKPRWFRHCSLLVCISCFCHTFARSIIDFMISLIVFHGTTASSSPCSQSKLNSLDSKYCFVSSFGVKTEIRRLYASFFEL